ncbi:radical SAM protein [Desulfoluna sp.]|uniref:radical SAM protein n=1 Tax=Desulfoluna sp. TaxID=2045199 RepID=UPI002636C7F1|nr:radical SAM protein [Desulfoluna sp.]
MRKTVSFTKDATNLFFHLLTACNLSCRHCYINPPQHGSNTLPIETIEEWLALFASRSKEANIIFLGGEPTLHPDLARAVKTARALGYASITIDTNGYLFHDILNKVTPEEVDALSFSLDGATAPTNDALRGEGCWETCVKGIREGVAKGFSTSLIYTVSGANLHELDQMPALLEAWGVEHFFIQVLGIRGNSAREEAEEEGLMRVTRDHWMEVVPKVVEEAARRGIKVTWPKVFLDEGEPFECAGNVADNLFLFPNGRVYRCPLCEDYSVHSMVIEEGVLKKAPRINESDLFDLSIAEGCVMNRIIQPGNIVYKENGAPEWRVACCLLKEEITP